MCGTRWFHNKHVVDDLKARRDLCRGAEGHPGFAGGAVVIYSAPASKALQAEASERGFFVFRRHLSPGDQGTLRSPSCGAMAWNHHDRPRRPPEVEKGHHGAGTERIYLVEDRADVARLARQVACVTRQSLAFVTQTTLSVDDTARVVEALKVAFPAIRPAAQGRHLLRDDQPARTRGQTVRPRR